MKFKVLFITFNIVLIFAFLFIFFLPLLVLGGNFVQDFWQSNWVLFTCFAALIAGIDILFICNWKLITILESEDWPALVVYLEKKIYVQKRISFKRVKLLCDSYILLSDFPSVERLGEFLKAEKKNVYVQYALGFASVLIIQGKSEEASVLMERCRGDKLIKNKEWFEWYYGFSYYLRKDFSRALDIFSALASSCRNPVVTALALYLLDTQILPHESGDTDATREVVTKRKGEITRKYTQKNWAHVVDGEKTEMAVVILGSILDDGTAWLFKKD